MQKTCIAPVKLKFINLSENIQPRRSISEKFSNYSEIFVTLMVMTIPPTDAALTADPACHRAQAEQARARGDELAALAHRLAARVLEANGADAGARLATVGTGYFMKGEPAAARRWYELA
ncbi:MAG TPA: hypothetical protein VGC69_07820, partial [Bordetella sp.]